MRGCERVNIRSASQDNIRTNRTFKMFLIQVQDTGQQGTSERLARISGQSTVSGKRKQINNLYEAYRNIYISFIYNLQSYFKQVLCDVFAAEPHTRQKHSSSEQQNTLYSVFLMIINAFLIRRIRLLHVWGSKRCT